jgi:predicted aspartyl protease
METNNQGLGRKIELNKFIVYVNHANIKIINANFVFGYLYVKHYVLNEIKNVELHDLSEYLANTDEMIVQVTYSSAKKQKNIANIDNSISVKTSYIIGGNPTDKSFHNFIEPCDVNKLEKIAKQLSYIDIDGNEHTNRYLWNKIKDKL